MSPSDDRIPWVTWLSGGAALVVLALTAVVLLSPKPKPEADAPVTKSPAVPTATASAPVPTPERHPLDISSVLMDARARATLFSESAALISVRLIIDQGRPLDPVEVTYAVAQGRPLPGAPVTSRRLRISYAGGSATQSSETDGSKARALPDPNCPLEAAFRAVQQAGARGDTRFFAVYAHSPRHKRPAWTFTSGDGGSSHVDADNCALLVR